MGGTIGNKNAVKENRLFSNALRRRYVQNPEKMAAIIDKLCAKAEETGELSHIREIMDRVDGRSIQATELTGADGGPIEYSDATKDELEAKIREFQKLPHIRALAGAK